MLQHHLAESSEEACIARRGGPRFGGHAGTHAERMRGREGERIVGQFLENARADAARVFHDLVGAGLNVNHVVVSPHGVFALETKSHSNASGADAVLQ